MRRRTLFFLFHLRCARSDHTTGWSSDSTVLGGLAVLCLRRLVEQNVSSIHYTYGSPRANVRMAVAVAAEAAARCLEESSDSEPEQEHGSPQKLIRKVSTSGQIRSKVIHCFLFMAEKCSEEKEPSLCTYAALSGANVSDFTKAI